MRSDGGADAGEDAQRWRRGRGGDAQRRRTRGRMHSGGGADTGECAAVAARTRGGCAAMAARTRGRMHSGGGADAGGMHSDGGADAGGMRTAVAARTRGDAQRRRRGRTGAPPAAARHARHPHAARHARHPPCPPSAARSAQTKKAPRGARDVFSDAARARAHTRRAGREKFFRCCAGAYAPPAGASGSVTSPIFSMRSSLTAVRPLRSA